MKSILALAVALASVMTTMAADLSVRYEERTETKCVTGADGKTRCVAVTSTVPVVYSTAPKASTVSLVTVPAGMHAHKMADGSTMIHGDENFGNAAAHAGVVGRNWPKPAYAGQTVSISTSGDGFCPTGTCPGSASASGASVTSTRIRESIRSGGFFRRLFSGRFLRGLAGGCP